MTLVFFQEGTLGKINTREKKSSGYSASSCKHSHYDQINIHKRMIFIPVVQQNITVDTFNRPCRALKKHAIFIVYKYTHISNQRHSNKQHIRIKFHSDELISQSAQRGKNNKTETLTIH